jgi:hypothetical protein
LSAKWKSTRLRFDGHSRLTESTEACSVLHRLRSEIERRVQRGPASRSPCVPCVLCLCPEGAKRNRGGAILEKALLARRLPRRSEAEAGLPRRSAAKAGWFLTFRGFSRSAIPVCRIPPFDESRWLEVHCSVWGDFVIYMGLITLFFAGVRSCRNRQPWKHRLKK